MFNKFIVGLILVFTTQVFANDLAEKLNKDFQGFVDIGTKELYVDFIAPQAGRPTVVLLNGLTYSTTQWDAMTVYLKKAGLGVVRYDMDGMGKTLLKYGFKYEPYAYMDQVQDLNNLLKVLKVPAPYNIVGLSYGGGIGAVYAYQYPAKVRKVILMAPYTEALKQQDDWIRSQIWVTRIQFPYNPYSDEQLYDYFLKQIVYSTYPSVEPIVLENPYKLEAVFRMTQGIRKLRLSDEILRFPKKSVYLVMAEKDQYIPAEIHEQFWNAITPEARVEKITVKGSEHKIPESKPKLAAELVDRIISNK